MSHQPGTPTDSQLLDLFLTAWVAGGVDNLIADATDGFGDHVAECDSCRRRLVDTFTIQLIAAWEDPAVRSEHIDLCRRVLAGDESEDTRIIKTTLPAHFRD